MPEDFLVTIPPAAQATNSEDLLNRIIGGKWYYSDWERRAREMPYIGLPLSYGERALRALHRPLVAAVFVTIVIIALFVDSTFWQGNSAIDADIHENRSLLELWLGLVTGLYGIGNAVDYLSGPHPAADPKALDNFMPNVRSLYNHSGQNYDDLQYPNLNDPGSSQRFFEHVKGLIDLLLAHPKKYPSVRMIAGLLANIANFVPHQSSPPYMVSIGPDPEEGSTEDREHTLLDELYRGVAGSSQYSFDGASGIQMQRGGAANPVYDTTRPRVDAVANDVYETVAPRGRAAANPVYDTALPMPENEYDTADGVMAAHFVLRPKKDLNTPRYVSLHRTQPEYSTVPHGFQRVQSSAHASDRYATFLRVMAKQLKCPPGQVARRLREMEGNNESGAVRMQDFIEKFSEATGGLMQPTPFAHMPAEEVRVDEAEVDEPWYAEVAVTAVASSVVDSESELSKFLPSDPAVVPENVEAAVAAPTHNDFGDLPAAPHVMLPRCSPYKLPLMGGTAVALQCEADKLSVGTVAFDDFSRKTEEQLTDVRQAGLPEDTYDHFQTRHLHCESGAVSLELAAHVYETINNQIINSKLAADKDHRMLVKIVKGMLTETPFQLAEDASASIKQMMFTKANMIANLLGGAKFLGDSRRWLSPDDWVFDAFQKMTAKEQAHLIIYLMAGSDRTKLLALGLAHHEKVNSKQWNQFTHAYLKAVDRIQKLDLDKTVNEGMLKQLGELLDIRMTDKKGRGRVERHFSNHTRKPDKMLGLLMGMVPRYQVKQLRVRTGNLLPQEYEQRLADSNQLYEGRTGEEIRRDARSAEEREERLADEISSVDAQIEKAKLHEALKIRVPSLTRAKEALQINLGWACADRVMKQAALKLHNERDDLETIVLYNDAITRARELFWSEDYPLDRQLDMLEAADERSLGASLDLFDISTIGINRLKNRIKPEDHDNALFVYLFNGSSEHRHFLWMLFDRLGNEYKNFKDRFMLNHPETYIDPINLKDIELVVGGAGIAGTNITLGSGITEKIARLVRIMPAHYEKHKDQVRSLRDSDRDSGFHFQELMHLAACLGGASFNGVSGGTPIPEAVREAAIYYVLVDFKNNTELHNNKEYVYVISTLVRGYLGADVNGYAPKIKKISELATGAYRQSSDFVTNMLFILSEKGVEAVDRFKQELKWKNYMDRQMGSYAAHLITALLKTAESNKAENKESCFSLEQRRDKIPKLLSAMQSLENKPFHNLEVPYKTPSDLVKHLIYWQLYCRPVPGSNPFEFSDPRAVYSASDYAKKMCDTLLAMHPFTDEQEGESIAEKIQIMAKAVWQWFEVDSGLLPHSDDEDVKKSYDYFKAEFYMMCLLRIKQLHDEVKDPGAARIWDRRKTNVINAGVRFVEIQQQAYQTVAKTLLAEIPRIGEREMGSGTGLLANPIFETTLSEEFCAHHGYGSLRSWLIVTGAAMGMGAGLAGGAVINPVV